MGPLTASPELLPKFSLFKTKLRKPWNWHLGVVIVHSPVALPRYYVNWLAVGAVLSERPVTCVLSLSFEWRCSHPRGPWLLSKWKVEVSCTHPFFFFFQFKDLMYLRVRASRWRGVAGSRGIGTSELGAERGAQRRPRS